MPGDALHSLWLQQREPHHVAAVPVQGNETGFNAVPGAMQ
jgi:hypothetical protein